MRYLPAAFFAFVLSAGPVIAADNGWKGVDETVVGKVAAEHGREARPFFCLEGDAQLFAFLVAGAAGGFMMGYFYRGLVSRKRDRDEG